MNQLAAWLQENDVKRRDFAGRAGISAGYLTDICADSYWPSREVFLRIRAATGGAVTPNDFLPAYSPEAAQ